MIGHILRVIYTLARMCGMHDLCFAMRHTWCSRSLGLWAMYKAQKRSK